MIDLDKPLKTRDGLKVLIYNRNGGGQYPVHGPNCIATVPVEYYDGQGLSHDRDR